MLRASMCEMNRSENADCSCRVRIIVAFWIRSTVVGTSAVAVPIRQRLSGQAAFTEEVARREHGDHRLPASRDRTDSFTPPCWM